MPRPKKEDVVVDNIVAPQSTTVDSAGPVPVEDTKKQTVELSRHDFDQLMAKLEKQTKDIELLYKASDKQRMAKAMNEGGEVLIKTAKVSTWADTGKFVIGWKLKTNRCEVVMGRWIEEQDATVVLEDGSTLTVPLIEFYRSIIKKISGDIISRTSEYDSQNNKIEILKIQFPNGKKISINSAFIN